MYAKPKSFPLMHIYVSMISSFHLFPASYRHFSPHPRDGQFGSSLFDRSDVCTQSKENIIAILVPT